MKITMIKLTLAGIVVVASTPNALSTTRYVDMNNSTPASPYTNWVSAATNIQQSVDAALAGDEIVVTHIRAP